MTADGGSVQVARDSMQAARRTADEVQVARESVQVARARSWENYCFALFHYFGHILSSTSPF